MSTADLAHIKRAIEQIIPVSRVAAIEYFIACAQKDSGNPGFVDLCMSVDLFQTDPANTIAPHVATPVFYRGLVSLGLTVSAANDAAAIDQFAKLWDDLIRVRFASTKAFDMDQVIADCVGKWTIAHANNLLSALFTQHPDIIRFARKPHAGIDVLSSGYTPINCAIAIGNNAALSWMLDGLRGLGLKPRNIGQKNCPFDTALEVDNVEALRLLAEHFATDLRSLLSDTDLLHRCIKLSANKCAVYLVDEKFILPTISHFRDALISGRSEVAASICVNAGYCLETLEAAISNEQAATVRYFVQHFMRDDPDALVRNGRSLLMYAADRGSVQCVIALLEEGANPLVESSRGKNAIEFAQQSDFARNSQIESLLLAACAADAVARAATMARRGAPTP